MAYWLILFVILAVIVGLGSYVINQDSKKRFGKYYNEINNQLDEMKKEDEK